MFLRDKVIVRTIKLPTIDSEEFVKVPVVDLGLEESEAKNANVMFAVHVATTGAINHATQVTWAFEQVGDDYCLVATDHNTDFTTGDLFRVFIQVEAEIADIEGTVYSV